MQRPVSILDQTPIARGSSSGEALSGALELARLADRLGYARIWYSEHHNGPARASATPEIMIAHVAAVTHTIRVGAGGIMLPNYAPLKVAETFRLLAALNPGRIDLGIGRASGGGVGPTLALCRSEDIVRNNDFVEQLRELLAYDDGFPQGHVRAGIRATPADIGLPPVWLLGSSAAGALLAAELGLGLAYAGFIKLDRAVEVLRGYRERFVPSGRYAEPRSILAVSVLVGEDNAHARRLANAHDLFVLLRQRKQLYRYPSDEVAGAASFTPAERELIDADPARALVGTAEAVRQQIEQLADQAAADEVMLDPFHHEYTHRENTLYALAEAFELHGLNDPRIHAKIRQ